MYCYCDVAVCVAEWLCGCLCVCHVDVLSQTYWVGRHATFTRLQPSLSCVSIPNMKPIAPGNPIHIEGVKCWEYVMRTLFSQLRGGLWRTRSYKRREACQRQLRFWLEFVRIRPRAVLQNFNVGYHAKTRRHFVICDIFVKIGLVLRYTSPVLTDSALHSRQIESANSPNVLIQQGQERTLKVWLKWDMAAKFRRTVLLIRQLAWRTWLVARGGGESEIEWRSVGTMCCASRRIDLGAAKRLDCSVGSAAVASLSLNESNIADGRLII